MKHTLHIFCLVLLASLASCYDEGWGGEPTLPVAAGEAVVKVSVPAGGGFGTRAYGDATADADEDERAIHSLWLLAYPTEGEDGEALVCPLGGSSTLEHDTWRTYNVTMKLGKYNIYVVANVEGISMDTTEDQLENMTLNYGKTVNGKWQWNLPNTEQGLPMVYKSETPFEVTAQGGTIWATLEFTCVKVTYTLNFDNTKDTGISFPTFGKNYLTVKDVTGKQVPPTGKLLLNTDNRVGRTFDCEEEALKGEVNSDATPGKWTYTATFYLPEHYVDNNEQSKQTFLEITTALHDENGTESGDYLKYTIPLGGLEDGTVNKENYDRSELRRGTWYQIEGNITTLGGELWPTVVVEPWKTATVDTDLESAYHLWVEQTALTQELPAGTAKTIACRTDAPELEASSSKITVDGLGEIDLFVVTLNREENGDYTGFTVQVNPDIPPTEANQEVINAAQDKCIWLHIPDPETDGYLLSKRIDIEIVKLDPYFIVNPPQYTIYLTEIGHQASYFVTFTYETNMTDVEVTCGGSDVLTNGIQWDGNENVTIAGSGLQENGTGTVTVTLDKPYDPSLYTKTQTITIDYVATDNRDASLREEAQTTVTIIPNAQTYRLHFRPVTDDWTNPHIYVYQILYTPDGKEVRIPDSNTTTNEFSHAVRYSFTGMRTFRGWESQGGEVDNPGTGTSSDMVNEGSYWEIQRRNGTTAWDPNDSNAGSVYNLKIDYCPDFREGTNCSQCNANQVKPSWPGVAMKEDDENPGWFYFDLPALATPGITMIMFAEGHDGPQQNPGESNDAYRERAKKLRYPAHLMPGVPLYDYADKDGWFLYDYTKGDDNGFVDDKPGIADLEQYTYRIWCGQTSYTCIHVWRNGTPITDWNPSTNAYDRGWLQTDAETGDKYFEFTMTPNKWGSNVVQYQRHNANQNGEGDKQFYWSEWIPVTGETYDYEYTIN